MWRHEMYIPTRVRQSGDARYPKIKDVAFIIITVIVASQFSYYINSPCKFKYINIVSVSKVRCVVPFKRP